VPGEGLTKIPMGDETIAEGTLDRQGTTARVDGIDPRIMQSNFFRS